MQYPLLLIPVLGVCLGLSSLSNAETLMAPSFKDPYKMVPIDGSQSTSNEEEASSTAPNTPAFPVDTITKHDQSEYDSPSSISDYDLSEHSSAVYNPSMIEDLPQFTPPSDFFVPEPFQATERYTFSPSSQANSSQGNATYMDYYQSSDPAFNAQAQAQVASTQQYLDLANTNTVKALNSLELPPCQDANPNAWNKCAKFSYHPNGQVKLCEPFAKGELTGWVVEMSPTGQIQSATQMKANVKNGFAQSYYPNGAIKNITPFKKDTLDGTEYTFYPNGALQGAEKYNKGRKHGSSKLYYENGQTMFEASYQNNQLVGVSTKYYPNGVVSERLPYSNGKAQGVGQQFYPDGSIAVEAPFINGVRNGLVKHYAQDGSLLSEIEYVKDQPQGKFTEYYANGQIKQTASFRLGQLNGEAKIYNEQGWLEHELNYIKGEITGEVRTYDQNGNLRARSLYQHSKPHGPTLYYTEQGLPWREINFYYGIPHGTSWLINPYGERYVRLTFNQGQLINGRCVISNRLLNYAEIQALVTRNILPNCP